MTTKRYQIVFCGEIDPGQDRNEVEKQMSALLKSSPEKIKKLFSGREIIIKKDVDHQTAQKFKKAFETTGAVCKLVEIMTDLEADVEIVEEVQYPATITMIVCPKCDHRQTSGDECEKCGFTFQIESEKKSSSVQRAEAKRKTVPHKEVFEDTQPEHAITPEASLFEAPAEVLKKYLMSLKNFSADYGRRASEALKRLILFLVITFIVNTGFLYACSLAWTFYIATPVGERFVTRFASRAQVIVDLLDRISVIFSLQLTVTAFVVCLAISAISRVFHIARRVYEPRSLFGKILVCGIPLTAVVAICIRSYLNMENWAAAYFVAFVPTMCLFTTCFNAARELLPEIGEFIKKAVPFVKAQLKIIIEKILAP